MEGIPPQAIGHPDKAYQLTFRRILIHINSAHHPYRKGEQRTPHHQIESTDNSRPYTATCHPVRRSRSDKIPTDSADSFIDDKSQNCKQYQYNAKAQQPENPESNFLRTLALLLLRISILFATF